MSTTVCNCTEDFTQVNGAVVNTRARTDKVAVWLADATLIESVMRIGKMIKQRLGIAPHNTIGFNVHYEEKNRTNLAKANKPKYLV